MCQFCEYIDFIPINNTQDYSGLEISINKFGLLRVRNYNFNAIFESQDMELGEKDKLYHEAYQQGRADVLFEQMNEPKEILLREGLELIQKECNKTGVGINCRDKCNVCDMNLSYPPQLWDIDEIVSTVEQLKSATDTNAGTKQGE